MANTEPFNWQQIRRDGTASTSSFWESRNPPDTIRTVGHGVVNGRTFQSEPLPGKKPKNATLRNLGQLRPNGEQIGAKSSLLEALLNRSGVKLDPKAISHKMKGHQVPAPKQPKLSAEEKAAIPPFILEHRVGTTERVTTMDPMSEDFIKSLRIPYKGRYLTKSISSTESSPVQILDIVVNNRISKLMKEAVPQVENTQPLSLLDLGRPWKNNGWINPSFRISTACIINRPNLPTTFSAAKVRLETWQYRECDFACSTLYADSPVRATLINKFEAVKDELICYSFIVKYGSKDKDLKSGDQTLVHVWINATYFEHLGRTLPMYFENAGTFSFMLNALTASIGLQIGPTGQASLSVTSKGVEKKTPLGKEQLSQLFALGVLVDFNKYVSASATPNWALLGNVNWEVMGYSFERDGITWRLSSTEVVAKLPWQVQDFRGTSLQSYPIIRRSLSTLGGSLAATRAILDSSVSERPAKTAKAVGESFWNHIKRLGEDGAATTFDPMILTLRTEYLNEELIEEVRRIGDDAPAMELFQATRNMSDRLGRFVFEKNLPGYTKPVAVEATVEAVAVEAKVD